MSRRAPAARRHAPLALIAGLAAVCLCLAALVDAASATLSNPIPRTLSAAGQDARTPQVAIDASDRATIVWDRSDGSNSRIQSVRLAADGTPGFVRTLSAAGQDAIEPRIAIDGSGRVTITWVRWDGSNSRIQSVRLAADGTPGVVRTLSAAGKEAGFPEVAVDGSGRATIVWQRLVGTGTLQTVESVRFAGDGTPGPVRRLSAAGRNATQPQIAIDGSERATVVWTGAGFSVESVRLGADGTPGPGQTLSGPGEKLWFGPRIAIDGSDRATVIWSRFDGSNYRIQSVRLAADGTPGSVQTLSDSGQNALDPEIAIHGSDRATVVWRISRSRIQSVRLAADGTPGPVQALSADGQNVLYPQVATDGSDFATVLWARDAGANLRIEAVGLAADGSAGPVHTLSAAGQDAIRPDIAIGGSGRATIAWSRSDGSSSRIQSVQFDGDLRASVSARRTQKQKGSRIVLIAKVEALEDLRADGKGKIKRGKKSYKLKRRTKSVSSGSSKELRLKPKKSRDAKKIAKALKKGKKAKAKLSVKLTDGAGNERTEKLSVKLKR